MELTTHTFTNPITPKGVDKVARYGWIMKTGPGKQESLPKDILGISVEYQRDLTQSKVTAITAAWSWASFGALVVSHRDRKYWVIDGQHRLAAAMRRSDVEMVPCVVFTGMSEKDEARAFFELNTGRRPVTAVAKHKALAVAEDPTALFVAEQIAKNDLTVSAVLARAGQIKCLGWCMKRAADSPVTFSRVLEMAAEMSARDKVAVQEVLLEGLWILHAKCGDGLDDKRLVKRLTEKGAKSMCDAARRATAYYRYGGGKVWAMGMLEELNKGLKHRFVLEGATEAE